jgi:DNA-binding HxlR family transcriptional regulator
MRITTKKIKKGNLTSPDCPGREIMDATSSLWSNLVLKTLLKNETVRFSEFKTDMSGVSEKMLSQTLKRLERNGFVERVSYPEIPPKVEYKLTKLGKGYAEIAQNVCAFIETNTNNIVKAQIEYDEKDQARPWQKPRR